MAYQRTTYRKVSDLRTSQAGVDLIKSFEGFVGHAYRPVAGEPYLTIGYGHYGPDVKPGQTITRAEAEKLLKRDISAKAADPIRSLVRVPMNQNQFDALVSLVFNIGSGNFTTSTVRRQLNRRHYRRARTAFLLWTSGASGRLIGLVRRRHAEMHLWRYGP